MISLTIPLLVSWDDGSASTTIQCSPRDTAQVVLQSFLQVIILFSLLSQRALHIQSEEVDSHLLCAFGLSYQDEALDLSCTLRDLHISRNALLKGMHSPNAQTQW